MNLRAAAIGGVLVAMRHRAQSWSGASDGRGTAVLEHAYCSLQNQQSYHQARNENACVQRPTQQW